MSAKREYVKPARTHIIFLPVGKDCAWLLNYADLAMQISRDKDMPPNFCVDIGSFCDAVTK